MPHCAPANPAVERRRYQTPSVGRKTEMSPRPSPSKSNAVRRGTGIGCQAGKSSNRPPVNCCPKGPPTFDTQMPFVAWLGEKQQLCATFVPSGAYVGEERPKPAVARFEPSEFI